MDFGGLGGCASGNFCVVPDVVNMHRQENQRSEPRAREPRYIPAVEPRSAHRGGLQLRNIFHGRQRERDDHAAVRAGRQMGKRLFALVGRQSVFSEGAELVRVGMLAGLEELTHR